VLFTNINYLIISFIKEISDLKAESSQIKIENRRLNDNVFDLMVDIEELEYLLAIVLSVLL
jgi:hypothetical protein